MTKLEAVLFDLDGLLADTEELHIVAYEAVGRYLSIDIDRSYIGSFLGGPTGENIKRIMLDHGISMDDFDEILKVRYDSYMDAIRTTPLILMEGALDCILNVKKNAIKTALVTSSIREHARAVLENLSKNMDHLEEIASLFDAMVFGDEIEHLKPAPDIYIEALRRLGTIPSRGIALEDSAFGVLSAKRAGLMVIAVPGPHTRGQDFSVADEVASSLTEVVRRRLIG